MPGPALRFAQRAIGHLHSGLANGDPRWLRVAAALAGLLVGCLVLALAASAERNGEPQFRLAMALIVLGSGWLSFVLYVLQVAAGRSPAAPLPRGREVRTCAGLMGCGVLVAIHGLQSVFG